MRKLRNYGTKKPCHMTMLFLLREANFYIRSFNKLSAFLLESPPQLHFIMLWKKVVVVVSRRKKESEVGFWGFGLNK